MKGALFVGGLRSPNKGSFFVGGWRDAVSDVIVPVESDQSAAKLLFHQQFDIERDDLEIIKMVINFLNLIR